MNFSQRGKRRLSSSRSAMSLSRKHPAAQARWASPHSGRARSTAAASRTRCSCALARRGDAGVLRYFICSTRRALGGSASIAGHRHSPHRFGPTVRLERAPPASRPNRNASWPALDEQLSRRSMLAFDRSVRPNRDSAPSAWQPRTGDAPCRRLPSRRGARGSSRRNPEAAQATGLFGMPFRSFEWRTSSAARSDLIGSP